MGGLASLRVVALGWAGFIAAEAAIADAWPYYFGVFVIVLAQPSATTRREANPPIAHTSIRCSAVIQYDGPRAPRVCSAVATPRRHRDGLCLPLWHGPRQEHATVTARPGACPDNLSAGGAELPERDRKPYRGL